MSAISHLHAPIEVGLVDRSPDPGQLVFELRRQLNEVEPGESLEVITDDPGAPVDVPAWCRMTGHTLVSAEHPAYVIRRKTD